MQDLTPLMSRVATIFVLLSLCAGAIVASIPIPLTTDEKVEQADLIVLGKATTTGAEYIVVRNGSFKMYERDLQIDVKDVLWPPSFKETNMVTFRYYVVQDISKLRWLYTNTPGVFFLKKNTRHEKGEWEMVGSGNDWIESATNALTFLFSIEKLKGKPAPAVLSVTEVPYPQTTRYDQSQKVRLAYLSGFRDGYLDALSGKHSSQIFGPITEEDKATVLGYADGRLSGDAARLEWMRKFHILMK
jgi:hypothetical protein